MFDVFQQQQQQRSWFLIDVHLFISIASELDFSDEEQRAFECRMCLIHDLVL